MFFTQEDYRKIEDYIKRKSIKDTQFDEAITPLDGEEEIAFVQNGKNVKAHVKDIVEQLFLLGVSDFVNVTDKYNQSYINLKEAIDLIPFLSRKKGQVITFINKEGDWVVYQFKGYNTLQWNNTTLWVNLFESIYINSILPDEEDLTKTDKDEQGNVRLKFKDKVYDPENFSGLGRVYLRKNIITTVDPSTNKTSRINCLTQDMLRKSNTIYIIQYDYDLRGEEITIPEKCILQFEGGSLKNGKCISNKTILIGNSKGNALYGIFYDIAGEPLNYNNRKYNFNYNIVHGFIPKESTGYENSTIQDIIKTTNNYVLVGDDNSGNCFIFIFDNYFNRVSTLRMAVNNHGGGIIQVGDYIYIAPSYGSPPYGCGRILLSTLLSAIDGSTISCEYICENIIFSNIMYDNISKEICVIGRYVSSADRKIFILDEDFNVLSEHEFDIDLFNGGTIQSGVFKQGHLLLSVWRSDNKSYLMDYDIVRNNVVDGHVLSLPYILSNTEIQGICADIEKDNILYQVCLVRNLFKSVAVSILEINIESDSVTIPPNEFFGSNNVLCIDGTKTIETSNYKPNGRKDLPYRDFPSAILCNGLNNTFSFITNTDYNCDELYVNKSNITIQSTNGAVLKGRIYYTDCIITISNLNIINRGSGAQTFIFNHCQVCLNNIVVDSANSDTAIYVLDTMLNQDNNIAIKNCVRAFYIKRSNLLCKSISEENVNILFYVDNISSIKIYNNHFGLSFSENDINTCLLIYAYEHNNGGVIPVLNLCVAASQMDIVRTMLFDRTNEEATKGAVCIYCFSDNSNYGSGVYYWDAVSKQFISGCITFGPIDNLSNNAAIGRRYFINNQNNNKLVTHNGKRWIDCYGYAAEFSFKGTINDRPVINSTTDIGFQYFDTTLNKPIWWTGTKWVDATGADV